MKVVIYYRKFKDGKNNYEMDQDTAARLTIKDLLDDYAKVVEIEQPEGTTAERIFAMYQNRSVKLPAGVEHESMSVGDIVILGNRKICICCRSGWYYVETNNICIGDLINKKEEKDAKEKNN